MRIHHVVEPMAIDRDFTLKTLQDLIRIDSRNPGLEAGAPGEWELAHHVASLLAKLDWEPQFQDLGNRRANVVAVRTGRAHQPSLMINVHMDTVGVAGMEDPFSGEQRDGRIWGRGSQDIKGGLAAVLSMAKALAEDSVALQGDLLLTFVADEEHESIGTAEVIRQRTADAAIVIEPSDLDICTAHRGFGIFRLRTNGRTAHGGRSDLGVDANTLMAHVLVALNQIRQAWQEQHRHAMLGTPSLHVPLLSGGRQLFMYADSCTAHLECRTVPGQTADGVHGELQDLLGALAARIDGFEGSIEPVLWRSPYEIDPGRPIVRTLQEAAAKIRKEPVRTIGHAWWEDAALLGGAGIECVVIGPRGGGLHTEEEWVDPESVVDLAAILYEAVGAYCGHA